MSSKRKAERRAASADDPDGGCDADESEAVMAKKACMSTAKDPENRSKKLCVCGGHSAKARKKAKAKGRARR